MEHIELKPIRRLEIGDRVELVVRGNCNWHDYAQHIEVGDIVTVSGTYDEDKSPNVFCAFITNEDGVFEKQFDSRYFKRV